MKCKLGVIAIGIVALAGLSACGKNVDVQTTGAQLVPGTSSLYFFCHEDTRIYISKWSTLSDEFEWFYPGGCQDGKPVQASFAPPNGDSTEDSNDEK